MEVQMYDPTNHKVFGYVNQEYFYKALQRAKIENVYVDEFEKVDINKLIQLLWETYSDGKYVIIENHAHRKQVIDFIKTLPENTGLVTEQINKTEEQVRAKKNRAKSKVEIDKDIPLPDGTN